MRKEHCLECSFVGMTPTYYRHVEMIHGGNLYWARNEQTCKHCELQHWTGGDYCSQSCERFATIGVGNGCRGAGGRLCLECARLIYYKKFELHLSVVHQLSVGQYEQQHTSTLEQKTCEVCSQNFSAIKATARLCKACGIVPRPCVCGQCGLQVKYRYSRYAHSCPTMISQRTQKRDNVERTYQANCVICETEFTAKHHACKYCDACLAASYGTCQTPECTNIVNYHNVQYCLECWIKTNPKRMSRAQLAVAFGWGQRISYNGFTFRSQFEVQFATELDSLSITWQYEPKRVPYQWLGRQHDYIPDFYLPAFDLFVEVKPVRRISELTIVKLRAVQQLGHQAVFCTELNFTRLLDRLNRKHQVKQAA